MTTIERLSVRSTYEGANQASHRMFRWQVPSAGPTQSVSESLATIRARARHLVRNNPIAASAVEEWVSNLIGSSGITPRWNLDDMKLKSELQALWSRWCEEADADGVYDFTGLQGLVARELIEAGEVFVRIRYRRATDGFSVPLQLQVLESDLVDELYSTVLPSGNVVRCGIELDKIGRRVAYWMFQEHPGEVTPFSSVSIDKKRIPAEQIIHVYRPLRAGQLRGISWLAPVIISLYELDQYEDAELVRKKTAAMFGGFIIEGGEPQLGVPLGADDLGRDIVALEPGTFVFLPPGTDVKMSQPADVGGQYEVWIKRQLMRIAKGVGLTYEQLTGDLSEVNYSSIRAGLIEFRRACRHYQLSILAHQLCRKVMRAWMDAAVLSGAVKIDDYWDNMSKYLSVTWHPDSWEWVDPLKDIKAEILAIRAGLKSRTQVVSERGRDIDQVDLENAEDIKRMRENGLNYITDPGLEGVLKNGF